LKLILKLLTEEELMLKLPIEEVLFVPAEVAVVVVADCHYEAGKPLHPNYL
jgi:hypothetical protein